MIIEDEELMRRYQAGDETAFNQLYDKYAPMVYAYIQKRLRASEVEDFYQKIWHHLHHKRSLYKHGPFLPWLFVLMRNLLIDEYRHLARRDQREISIEAIEKISAPEAPGEIEINLNQLPEETQLLVKKYYLEGVSYEELHTLTGLSQLTLRQRLSRALKVLRKKREDLQ
jgi:RNA polymerase sigma factor (sigma-70 family)